MTPQQLLDQAVEHHRAARFPQAEALYRQVLQLEPNTPDAINLLGVLAGQQGRHAEAVELISQAIALLPSGPYHTNLAEALRASGRFPEAVQAYREALKRQSVRPQVPHALGLVLEKLERVEEAIAAHRQALAIDPGFAPAHESLCALLSRLGRHQEAAELCRRSINADPTRPNLHAQLGAALTAGGDHLNAVAAFSKALELRPNWPQIHLAIAEIYQRLSYWPQAADAARKAIALDSAMPVVHAILAYALEQMGQLTASTDAYRQELQIRPDDVRSRAYMSAVLMEIMQFDEAIASYRQARTQDPTSEYLHSDLLLAMNYVEGISNEELFAEHKRWAAEHTAPIAPAHVPQAPAIDSSRPLRVGYVSPDLKEHPVAIFFESLLSAHDRTAVQPIIYSDVSKSDDVTLRLRKLVPAEDWHDVAALNPEQLARQISTDRLDILVDLAGHTGRNRMPTFARKPAPIQVTYLGYPNTTGLPRSIMDYRLTDARCDPPGMTESLHTENLIRLPDVFICYRPAAGAPPVATPPFEATGAITFGSFNAMQKVSPGMINAWGRILSSIPGSRLTIKNRTLGDTGVRRHVQELFARHGIGEDRLVLIPPLHTLASHLARYGTIDIALDTFPYHGTTTTCDALWMGVPVITLAGRAHRSRVGVSLLTCVGLEELIAQDIDQYIELATSLARDTQRLKRIRAELRPKMQASPLMDAPRLARNIEAAYREMCKISAATARPTSAP
ncbi:MAG TPA: tetratricopeptide repeat protein [Humisphaera sp.]|jgi:predicted O-linked N-acetylglucosamine transferase (SPINDLY family)|nr:tetratricopeptide repeat protein [Humisphaera sp.]